MTNRKHNSGTLRIIGGEWRGRRLSFAAVEDLRPTSDRIRETLFNWLQNTVEGARCLDLFAGSGALGFEALSRGAWQVVMVESQTQAVASLKNNCDLLSAERARIEHSTAEHYLGLAASAFDIVFLDPPFRSDKLAGIISSLSTGHWLAPRALVYVETPAQRDLPALPAHWAILKDKKAGQVRYLLLQAP